MNPTPLQLEVLEAYQAARHEFDRIDTPDLIADPERASIARAQLAAIRWANRHRPTGPDVVVAMHLIGALARLDGGATLGVESSPAYRIDGWLHALWWAAILAGANRLAIAPVLHVADRMRAAEPWDGVTLAATYADLQVITTAPKSPARKGPDLDAERMALFGALGSVVTVATLTLIRTVTGWPRSMTLGDWYRVAVETVTGERMR